MKWMIRVDMEGVTGVVNMNQVVPGAADYHSGLRMLKHDLASVLEGLLLAPEDRVVLYDIHFWGTNVELDELDPRVSVICGKPNYTPDNMSFVNDTFDGVILLGLHSKAGTPGGLLAHNYEHDIVCMSVNGLVVGEIGLEALIAGEAGVPLVMVTADSEGARETNELLPGTLTVVVKESLGDMSALCYPPSLTRKRLKAAAALCVETAPRLTPFLMSGPIELDMKFKPGALLDKLKTRIYGSFVDEDRIILTGGSVIEAWEQYLIAKA
ncbi:hypothetical protein FE784_11595 [Paenibacillus hemerocallicola]|uniref:Aminopeptidase n=1 Tax=Paenibacillus hemerocallicola TaxID=1172614 RepID=A0A5C4TBT1_9BACL|nr:M55 family metallopeptidase [Paenibacillus hemerocallicola]TNJ66060.1 hypothetical protein FE784_11595 [Paenibacillus hemerocallicola]